MRIEVFYKNGRYRLIRPDLYDGGILAPEEYTLMADDLEGGLRLADAVDKGLVVVAPEDLGKVAQVAVDGRTVLVADGDGLASAFAEKDSRAPRRPCEDARAALHREACKALFFFEGHAFRNGFLEANACRKLMNGIRDIDESLCARAGGQAWRPRDWTGVERPEGLGVDERGADAAFDDGVSYLLWRLSRAGSDRGVAYLSEYAEMVRAVANAAALLNGTEDRS